MSGFCGQCGTPKAHDAKFCMSCGSQLDVPRMCPTCGQHWPQDSSNQPEHQFHGQDPVILVPLKAAKGIYATAKGAVFFDGTQAWVAIDQGGIFLPDKTQEIVGFAHDAVGTTLILKHDEDSQDRPTGPALGPNYVTGRDCGNCGFELASVIGPCSHCGSSNTGPNFDPRLLI
jgi:hypothetical protein